MSSVSGSVKTRSVASASSKNSTVRRETELAKLRLAQQRQRDELERQLQEADRQRQEIERQLRDSELLNEVERLQLKAEFIEQGVGEVGEDRCAQPGGGDSKVQSSVAARRRPLSDSDSVMHRDTLVVTAADRTRRWVDGSCAPPLEGTLFDTWIDHLDLPNVSDMGHPERPGATDITMFTAGTSPGEVQR